MESAPLFVVRTSVEPETPPKTSLYGWSVSTSAVSLEEALVSVALAQGKKVEVVREDDEHPRYSSSTPVQTQQKENYL